MSLSAPVVPGVAGPTLADVMPSVAGVLGMPGAADSLDLAPDTVLPRVCILLVDGMGWHQLRRSGSAAPLLQAALPGARVAKAGFPSTTATSLTTLGTGLSSGRHGVLGYQLARPDGGLFNAVRWDPPEDPDRWQPRSTVFERLVEHGVPVHQVGPGRFAQAGLTRAAFRGTHYVAADSAGELIAHTASAVLSSPRGVCYAYFGDLDATGHRCGVRSAAWVHQLSQVDTLVEQLAEALPDDVVLLVTADHGMVDVAVTDQVDIEADPDLAAGVRVIAGEARARYLHTEPGAAGDVLDTWRARLGDRMWIASRDEAVAAGWFGTGVDPELIPRIGDVVACAATSTAAIAGRTQRGEAALRGLHGSLTEDEQDVPVLRFLAGEPLP